MRIAHVSPFDPDEPGVVQDHVRAVSSWLAAQGHEVVVAAPSRDRARLRDGRQRLAALAAGDQDALAGTPGEPLALALGRALPLKGRAAIAVPAAAAAGAGLLAAHGELDIVHVHEPGLPVDAVPARAEGPWRCASPRSTPRCPRRSGLRAGASAGSASPMPSWQDRPRCSRRSA